MLSWFQENSAVLLTLLGILSVVTFVGSLVALPLLVARLPADYFVRTQQVTLPWRTARPVRNSILCVLRNLLGFLLVLGGLAMLFLPGQGVLTIAVGLLMMDLPKKRAFQGWVISWKPVQGGINWLRRKAHQPDLILGVADATDQSA